ncbi:hypothetical protein AA15669_0628 [Saccharibacter floricola DSM 15669]|uniref:Transposase n=1 Tax=Saccharibacter floricola DSM 15669 TaxID=1123227 RepID=A0ABQ0NXW1_9PROT|nr:hypothetical protein AA15669_0628 [Saccharibacter floricola DSM 15669]
MCFLHEKITGIVQNDLTDLEWAIIGSLLPSEHGRWAVQGVLDALLQTLVELELTDDWQDRVDSTVVRVHS